MLHAALLRTPNGGSALRIPQLTATGAAQVPLIKCAAGMGNAPYCTQEGWRTTGPTVHAAKGSKAPIVRLRAPAPEPAPAPAPNVAKATVVGGCKVFWGMIDRFGIGR